MLRESGLAGPLWVYGDGVQLNVVSMGDGVAIIAASGFFSLDIMGLTRAESGKFV